MVCLHDCGDSTIRKIYVFLFVRSPLYMSSSVTRFFVALRVKVRVSQPEIEGNLQRCAECEFQMSRSNIDQTGGTTIYMAVKGLKGVGPAMRKIKELIGKQVKDSRTSLEKGGKATLVNAIKTDLGEVVVAGVCHGL